MSVHRDNRYVHICFLCHLFHPSMRWRSRVSSAHVRIEDSTYVHSMYSSFNPCLGPLHFHTHSSCLAVCLKIKLHIYKMKALSNRSAMFFMFRIYTMACWSNACWASINITPTWNNKDMSTFKRFWMKTKTKRTNYRLIFLLQPAHSEEDMCCSDQIHAVHCWDTFSHLWQETFYAWTPHTKHLCFTSGLAKINGKTFNWSNSPITICLSLCVRISLTFVFQLWNVKIHLQPGYWDKWFTVTILHTILDSYL